MKITKNYLKEIIKEAIEDYPENMSDEEESFPPGWTHERYAQVEEIETRLMEYAKYLFEADIEEAIGRLANKVQQGDDEETAKRKVEMMVNVRIEDEEEY